MKKQKNSNTGTEQASRAHEADSTEEQTREGRVERGTNRRLRRCDYLVEGARQLLHCRGSGSGDEVS